ncbi:ABC transporter ATP-binding protein [Jannaschia sp. M317]|uniref:ABC transporter ATP-binding protein n=1 Tax=Jannaschia sp. M317 TaxID=2867011 RepID=UPI0021A883D5|nr:ABC transporter ATP-binding protein [Jannaschia sp. M317]UWQ19881.1 ABC transporter ATP-binding protein [Jannaschia sp. M317]
MSSIELRSLTKRFGDFTAVDGIDLDIADGDFVALLGPSGCGKTTTMNMIAGLEDPTDGEILFGGQNLSSVPIQDRNIGFVFQNYAIFTHMSVYKNLAFALEVRGLSRSEIDTKVRAMASRMNLDHRLDMPAAQLSVNELQKLAIGRSAVAEPRIFLLDEPLSSVDATFRAYMRAELKVLQREFGQTMVYVTHDQIEAMSLADKIAVIDQGKLMQYGTPFEVYSSPANRFVANFVGTPRMNLFDGELETLDGAPVLRAAGGTVIPLGGRLGASTGGASARTLSLGVRPQDVYFGPRRNDDDIVLHGTVEEIERSGPSRLAYLRIGETKVLAVDDENGRIAGEDVQFNLAAASCLAFDFETGHRLGGTAR